MLDEAAYNTMNKDTVLQSTAYITINIASLTRLAPPPSNGIKKILLLLWDGGLWVEGLWVEGLVGRGSKVEGCG